VELVITIPWLFKYFFRSNISAFAFYPFIVLKSSHSKNDSRLIQHERIHLKQQLELFIVPFYILYFLEFVIHYIRKFDAEKAYRSISFEKEAFDNDRNPDYILHRKILGMWRS
jgi:hypothetical protein